MNGTAERTRTVEAAAVPARRRAPVRLLAVLLLTCLLATVAVRSLRDTPSDPAPLPTSSTVPSADSAVPMPPVHDQDSAVRSAVSALVELGSTSMYDSSLRRDRLAELVVPDALDALDAGFGQTAANLGLDQRGQSTEGALVARYVPVGTHVVSYSPDTAVVSVWMTALLGVAGPTSRRPVQESWSTETVTMTWTGRGWRWAGSSSTEGPVPVGSAQVPSDAAALANTQQLDPVTQER